MIELDINKRWEEGTPHHPESEAAIKAMADLDFYFGDDRFNIKTGGDGDNGEHFMYLLDIYFEARDQGIDLKTIYQKGRDDLDVKMAALQKRWSAE